MSLSFARLPSAALAFAFGAALVFTTTSEASAQDPAPAGTAAPEEGPRAQGTVGAQAPASAGATNLEENKFATAAAPGEATDATEAEISAGGLFTSGNARSGALTGGGRLRLRRQIHEFQAQVVGNYAQASIRQDDGTRTGQLTAGNVQGRVRYDVYFHPRVTFFTMLTARFDPFLGLNLRMRVDPGFAFYILNDPKHRLWAEVGYDFLFDQRRIRRGADASACPAGTTYVLDVPNTTSMAPLCASRPSVATHSGRAFLGYSNLLSEYVTFTTGLEYIQAFAPFRSNPNETDGGGARAKSWINWDVALTTALGKRFAFATSFTLRYDNAPLPGIKRLDTITSFSLVFRFI
jgi:putative salt-induced outer membrane protein YdiY